MFLCQTGGMVSQLHAYFEVRAEIGFLSVESVSRPVLSMPLRTITEVVQSQGQQP